MSAVYVNERTQILAERTQILRATQHEAAEKVDESWAVSLLDNYQQEEKTIISRRATHAKTRHQNNTHSFREGSTDKTQIAFRTPSTNTDSSFEPTVVAFAKKNKPKQVTRDSLTIFDNTNHSNSVGLLAARELFEKALQDKGKLLNKRFVLESVLGFGGMGVVYLTKDLRRVEAEDPYPYVATKVLNDDFKNHPDAFVALQQEAVKSQKLSHPNIVTVYDFDRDGNTLYMTMELLRGNSLDKLIKHNFPQGMPLNDAFSIFNGLCSGLTCAHKNKLIHSDFKPMNVFITFGQEAKILDFGISRICSDNDINQPRFDAGNLGAITLEYASLEMIQKQTPRFSDDVYALACVFYIVLTGTHPYNKVPANQALKKKMIPAPIESLSKRQWHALKKGLALESKNRYQSVDEFNKDFNRQNILTLTEVIAMISITALSITTGLNWILA